MLVKQFFSLNRVVQFEKYNSARNILRGKYFRIFHRVLLSLSLYVHSSLVRNSESKWLKR